jgi:hypothetical protein
MSGFALQKVFLQRVFLVLTTAQENACHAHPQIIYLAQLDRKQI